MPDDETVVVRTVASLQEAEKLLAELCVTAARLGLEPPQLVRVDVGREVTLTLRLRNLTRWLEAAPDALNS